MTAVARVLSRWDKRLLRFVTGLVMLALAFAMPAAHSPLGLPEAPAASVSVTLGGAQAESVTLRDPASAFSSVRDQAAAPTSEITSVEAPASLVALGSLAAILVGLWPGVRAERAPPTA